MTRIIIKHPDRDVLKKWGILAHVEENERNRILASPHGQFSREITNLIKEVDIVKFPRRKKSIVSESWYNSKNKQQPKGEAAHDEPNIDEQ